MIVTKSVQNMENIQKRRKIEKNAYMNEKTVVKKRSNEKWLQYKRLHIGNAQSLSNDLDDNEQHMTQLPPRKLFVSFYHTEGFYYAKK